ncbi:MAG: hypothetical protein PVI90_13040 [Desulfobacteraceae bacterium]|jgi:hypothetical protein
MTSKVKGGGTIIGNPIIPAPVMPEKDFQEQESPDMLANLKHNKSSKIPSKRISNKSKKSIDEKDFKEEKKNELSLKFILKKISLFD